MNKAASETETKDYRLDTYIIAALGLTIMGLSADSVKGLNRENHFVELFRDNYDHNIELKIISDAINLMSKLNLLTVEDDQFAGRYIIIQKTAFAVQFKEVAEQLPGSPIAIALRAGRPWIEEVLRNDNFWQKISNQPRENSEQNSEISEPELEVPASDRSVTLLHNSPERIEIEENLENISEALRTNNEIAEQLGDERERIAAELDAAKVGMRPERIRLGYIRDSVLKVLRELGTKLKDKAIDLGVDRLIILLESLLDKIS